MKKSIIFGFALIFSINLFAQESASDASIPKTNETAITHLTNQIKNFPQEKIYLHIDKPYYSAGERIWFRAYMVHATVHTPFYFSRYLYVELLNAHNEVVLRKKIRPIDETQFFGQIELSPDIAEGWYSIRAYTKFMQNIDEDYFFRQRVFIGNSLKGINGVTVDENTGSYNSDFKKATEQKADFDIQFFPEGGHLIAGNLQMVGFKAITKNGLGTDVSGRIVDEQNKDICTFKSSHLGMGILAITPEAGKTYSAICEDNRGLSMTIKLPEVSVQHYALVMKQSSTLINVSVLTPNAAPRTDTLYLIVNLRGLPIFQSSLLPESAGIAFSKKGVSSGVAQLLLLNKNGEILSERMLYIFGEDKANLNLTLDKPYYMKRDAAHAAIVLKDSKGHPVEGDFSISVTDDNDVKIDPNETTIESYLLLQSDLKGYVENPNWYFNPANKNASFQMDLLMLTQGWKRYDVPAVLAGNYDKGRGFSLEQGLIISGKVQNFPARRGLPNNNVTFLVHKKMGFDMTTTDNRGRFSLKCPEYPDSTKIMIQAEKKPGAFIELVVYPDTFPKVGVSCVYPDDIKQNLAMKDFLKKSRDRYYYQNGMKSVTLKDVVVTAKKVDKNKKIRDERAGGMYSYPSYTFDEEAISRATNLANLLMQAPGVTVSSDGTSITIRNNTPLIMVDNMECSMEELSSISPSDVQMIDILKDPSETMMFGSKGQGGVIYIYLKRMEDREEKEPEEMGRNQVEFIPLGYSLPAEFYVPRYQMEENRQDPIPDLRSTIFWKPVVKSNANGQADIFFYTADTPGTYTITAEGITPGGEIIHYQGKLNRK